MRQLSYNAGALLHKRSNAEAMTKAELKAYVDSRENLVSQLGVFGSELPSTAMQWKREGNELEWIVRQMSWLPPWTKAGCAEARRDVRRLSSYVRVKDRGSPAKRRLREEYTSALLGDAREEAVPEDEARAAVVSVAGEPDSPRSEAASFASSSVGARRKRSALLVESDSDGDCASVVASSAFRSPQQADSASAKSDEPSSEDEGEQLPPSTWRADAPLPWRCLPKPAAGDPFGYSRSPAFWFTLNLAYNHTFDIHRFHRAVALARGDVPDQALLSAATSNTHEARGFRCNWVRDNGDIVAFLHALRVELQVRLVTQHVVPCTDAEPFLYWLRFEWGTNGNPHAHGQCYVSGNPSFESVVEDPAIADLFARDKPSTDVHRARDS